MILIIIIFITIFGEILYQLLTNFIENLFDTEKFKEEKSFSFVFYFFLKTTLPLISAILAIIFAITWLSL